MATAVEDGNILIQNEEFLGKTYRAALWPGMLSILSGCVNIIADGVLVGQKIGAGGLAAINLCVPIYLILCIAGSFFVSGAAICSSKEIGANRRERAALYYRYAVTLCLIASVVMTAAGVGLIDVIAVFLCSDSQVLPMVKDYALVTLAGAFPKIFLYVPFWYLRLDGKNKTVTVMMTIMGAGNVALDVAFLYGLDMGVFGAALASVIATAACLAGFMSLHRGTFHFKSYVFAALSLLALLASGITPWLFLTAGELLTVCVWYLITGILHRRSEMTSRYFLMDQTLEKAGRVINFSVISDNEKICEASERITDFCQENGMQAKQVMRVSLALEEMMNAHHERQRPQRILFDIRVYAVPSEIDIRIRYNGKSSIRSRPGTARTTTCSIWACACCKSW